MTANAVPTSLVASSASATANMIFAYDSHNNPAYPAVTGAGELFFQSTRMSQMARYGVPTVSSCGTLPSITTGTSNSFGRIVTGSGATTCTITFSRAYAQVPFCVVTSGGAGAINYAVSTTSIAVTSAVATTNIDFVCTDQSL
jgi:hypothetical protein